MFVISLLCSCLKMSECLKCTNLMYKYILDMNQTCRVTLLPTETTYKSAG